MWLVVLAVPFFFLGMQVRSWRAPVYALGICFGLFVLWLLVGLEGGSHDPVLGAIVAGACMLASYLGAIVGVLLAPKPGSGEAPQGERDVA